MINSNLSPEALNLSLHCLDNIFPWMSMRMWSRERGWMDEEEEEGSGFGIRDGGRRERERVK
jgi:hypothetical protein